MDLFVISAYRIQQCTKCYVDVGFVGGGTPPPSPAFAPAKISGFGSPSATKPGLSLGAVLLQGAQGRLCCVCLVRSAVVIQLAMSWIFCSLH